MALFWRPWTIASSLQRQIHLAFGLVSGFVLIAAAITSGFSHWLLLEKAQYQEAQALGEVLANNLAAPLLFRDEEAAQLILRSLKVRHDIDCALLIDQFGQPFAHQALANRACQTPRSGEGTAHGLVIASGNMVVVVPISLNGDTVGSLMLQINQKQVMAILERTLWILSGALVLLLLLAYPISTFLSRRITSPISSLSEIMAEITVEGHYHRRAEERGPQEILSLSRSFNRMLEQVKLREDALEQHQRELEEKVAERTADLEIKQRELEQLARMDSLTALYNRRYFVELATQELRRSVRHIRTLSLLMLDLDHFKRVNDTYGHFSGDVVLKGAAETLRRMVRQTDLIGRLGGEEFALILPETGEQEAKDLAQRICEAMVAREFSDMEGARYFHVSCSIGVTSTLPDAETQLEHLLKLADDALYLAKENGRNRVETL
ncbi:MAG: diguanylate cyclase [Gammaproteobacteria bacterium]|nr:diguanylate cyclase [Gammaproteobacteria bacterium]